jgi:16S rRNA processing protein RimM
MSDTVEVVVGVIGRGHGVRGEVAVELRTDEPDRRFAPGQQLRAEGTSRFFTVLSTRNHPGGLLVRFDEVADRTTADSVRGTLLVADVDVNERPDHSEEFYDRQLIGLVARTADETVVGQVTSILHLPQQDLIEIDTRHGGRLIPFVEALIPEVDLEGGWLRIADVPGLIDGEEA